MNSRKPSRCFAKATRIFASWWLDIEDDSAIAGDIDVENFPSLAVYRGGVPVFFGVTEPQHGVVERLIVALTDAPPQAVPAEVVSLYRHLAESH